VAQAGDHGTTTQSPDEPPASESPAPEALDMSEVEVTVTSALSQRAADRRAAQPPTTGYWNKVREEVYTWKGAKTYLAMLLVGLVARATSDKIDARSLQANSGQPGSFNAARVWEIFYNHSEGRIFLLNLKRVPFNNSPFYGKRYLDPNWENVRPANRARLTRLATLLDSVNAMTKQQAAAALRDFMTGIPDSPNAQLVKATASGVNLPALFEATEQFLLDNSEGGRRGQAFVAACFGLIHGDRVFTPTSVNDPSRSEPGDVRVTETATERVALFVEAKQKLVKAADVHSFAKEVRQHDPTGVAGYAALVNDQHASRSSLAGLPTWQEVLEKDSVLMGIWSNPAELLGSAIIWSARGIDSAAAEFSALFARYLVHVGVEAETVQAWRDAVAGCGVMLELD
jgi:hypothetical protein